MILSAPRRRAALVAPLVLFALTVVAPAVHADDPWTGIGPHGVSIAALAVDSSTAPATLYVGLDGVGFGGTEGPRGVLKSSDGGKTWQNVGDRGIVVDGMVQPVVGLAVDPAHPLTVYAGTVDAGLFKSTTGGLAWEPSSTGMESPLNLSAIAVDPSHPQTVYASGAGDEVYKSLDGGANWVALEGDPVEPYSIVTLAIDPTDTQTVYGGTFGEGILKTTDGGVTWAFANDGLDASGSIVSAIAIDPGDSQVVYALAEDHGVFKTTDAGGHWTVVNTGLENTFPIQVSGLAIDQVTPENLYVGRFGGQLSIYKTTNGAAAWSPNGLAPLFEHVVAIAGDAGQPHRFYAATQSLGVFVTDQPPASVSSGGGCALSASGPSLVPLLFALLLGAAMRRRAKKERR